MASEAQEWIDISGCIHHVDVEEYVVTQWQRCRSREATECRRHWQDAAGPPLGRLLRTQANVE